MLRARGQAEHYARATARRRRPPALPDRRRCRPRHRALRRLHPHRRQPTCPSPTRAATASGSPTSRNPDIRDRLERRLARPAPRSTPPAAPPASRARSPSPSPASPSRSKAEATRPTVAAFLIALPLLACSPRTWACCPSDNLRRPARKPPTTPTIRPAASPSSGRPWTTAGFSVVLRAEAARASTAASSKTPRRPAARRQPARPPDRSRQAPTGATSSPPSSAPCSNARSIPLERHKLGAHYTPRAYVERLVLPTVIEPLRAEWHAVQAAADHPSPTTANSRTPRDEVTRLPPPPVPPCAYSTRPAAPAISSTSPSNT